MTEKATIRQSDLNRMAMTAKKHGVVVEIEINGMIVRVKPETEVSQLKTAPRHDTSSLEAWRNRHKTHDQFGKKLKAK